MYYVPSNSPSQSEPPQYEAPQFSLAQMLLAMAVLAGALALCVQLGVVGGLVVWAAAVVLTLATFRRPEPLLRAVRLLVWGVGMPLVCLVFDPGIIAQGSTSDIPGGGSFLFGMAPRLGFWHFLVYGVLGYPMLAMTYWLFRGRRGPREEAFLHGTLMLGVVISMVFALTVCLFAGIALLAGVPIALLGFTPAATAWAFWVATNASRAKAAGSLSFRSHLAWAMAGIFAACVLPGGAAALVAMLLPRLAA